MIRINLLPIRAAQKKEKLRAQLSVLFLCLLLVGVVCGALYYQQSQAISRINGDIKALQAENKKLKKTLGEIADYDKKKQALQAQLDVLNKLEADRSGPVRLLDELSKALPDLPQKVWLTKFSERGNSVNIDGFGEDEKAVANFMRNLEASGYYQNIELSVTQQARVGGVQMQKFTLRCQKETPGPKAKD